MNNLESASTWDLIRELQQRKGRGVDFWMVKHSEQYQITLGLLPNGQPRPVREGSGPAFIFEITDVPVWMLRNTQQIDTEVLI